MTRCKRRKAWLGAAISGAIGIGSSIFGGNAQKRAMRKQLRAQNKVATLEEAANLSNAYGDQNYVDDFENKIAFRNGGYIRRNRLFACGGRKKYADGGNKFWTSANTNALISGASSAISNGISSIFNASTSIPAIQTPRITTNNAKDGIKATDYANSANYNTLYSSPLYMCGGRIRKGSIKRK